MSAFDKPVKSCIFIQQSSNPAIQQSSNPAKLIPSPKSSDLGLRRLIAETNNNKGDNE
jgi:hypothetical protein